MVEQTQRFTLIKVEGEWRVDLRSAATIANNVLDASQQRFFLPRLNNPGRRALLQTILSKTIC